MKFNLTFIIVYTVMLANEVGNLPSGEAIFWCALAIINLTILVIITGNKLNQMVKN